MNGQPSNNAGREELEKKSAPNAKKPSLPNNIVFCSIHGGIASRVVICSAIASSFLMPQLVICRNRASFTSYSRWLLAIVEKGTSYTLHDGVTPIHEPVSQR